MLEWLKAIDRDLLLGINSTYSPFMDSLMWLLSMTWPTLLLVLIIALSFYRRHQWKKALVFLLGCIMVFACTDISTNIVKHSVKRYRPTHNPIIKERMHIVQDYYGGKWGFFSAHASNTVGVVTFMFFCVRYIRWRTRLLLFIYPLLVMYSRVYLGVHYPSDVITGMLSGLFFGWLVYKIMNAYFLKQDEVH